MPGMPVTTTTISTFGYGRPCMPPSIFGGYPMMGCGIGMPMMGGCCCGGGINPMLQIAGGFALGSALANSGIITSLFNCIGNAVGWTWNNVIQPGANWAWNNVLQPFGNWAWNSVLKPTGQWLGATASNLYVPITS